MGFRNFLILVFSIIFWLSISCLALDHLDCRHVTLLTTCDQCIRCGGVWCLDPFEFHKCMHWKRHEDEWCPHHKQVSYMEFETDDRVYHPQLSDVLAEINSRKLTTLNINKKKSLVTNTTLTPYFIILNSTQPINNNVEVLIDYTKSGFHVTTVIRDGFCTSKSQRFEYVYLEAGIRGSEKVVLKYHVPCSCPCSGTAELGALACNGAGSLVCGACKCNVGRRGKNCQCGRESSSCVGYIWQKCSGNGYCDKCKKCHCYDDVNKPGSQYYDPNDNCKGLNQILKETLACMHNKKAICGQCHRDLFYHKWDKSVLNQKFDAKRKLWIRVNLVADMPDYWAYLMNSTLHVMREPSKCRVNFRKFLLSS